MKSNKPKKDIVTIANMESQLPKIMAWLKSNRKLGVILIDMTPYFEMQLYYSKSIYQSVTRTIHSCIASLRGKEIRRDDIIALNLTGGSKYYIFLSKSREKSYVHVDDYEKMCLRLYDALFNALFATIFPITHNEPKLKLGYAFTFYNPYVEEIQFLQNLIHEAEVTAGYLQVKIAMIKRKLLYKIIVDEDLQTRYQPIINLSDNSVLGYEAFIQGPDDSLFTNAYSLFNFASTMGLVFELDWISKKKIIKNARGIAKNKKLFIKIVPSNLYKHELFAEQFMQILKENDIGLDTLVFELSDEPVAECISFMQKLMRFYNQIKCAVVIKNPDDEECLKVLQDSGIAYIKLGLDLIRHIDSNTLACKFIEQVNKAAQTINCDIVAEGVHHQNEMQKLVELGVKYGQGYFFARPENRFIEKINVEEYLSDKELEKNLLAYIYFKRGKSYFEKADYDKAILEFTKVLEVDEEHVEALYYRAYSFCEEGGVTAALKDMKTMVSINPAFPEAQFLQGMIFHKKGDLPAALRAYSEYIDRSSEDSNIHIELASKRIIEMKRKLKQD
ncbi:MAG: EAL domain-containing protein [Spirochaetales bacterium]|nr:EAL domain-containing protein [Spirochaetales bacterium]